MEQKNTPFLLEMAAKWFGKQVKDNTVPILACVIFGMLAYGFAFTNKLVNHDEVYCLFSKGATVDSGRWGLGLLDMLLPNYSMPWLYGILTIVLMTASICILLRIFSIQSKLLQVLTAGCILVFPSLIGTFGYMFTSSAYGISFLLAVLAVWLFCRPSKWYALPALVCMVASLSIYQSYIAIAASLLVLVLIQRLLYTQKTAPVICQGIWFVAFLLVSLGLYCIATGIVLRITGREFNSYASNSVTFSLSSIPGRVALAYSSFLRFFTEGYRGLMPTALSRFAHWLCLGAAGVLLMIWGRREKAVSLPRLLLLLILILLLPLAVNCMYLITAVDSIHTLVLYSFVAVYLLAAILAEACLSPTIPGKLPALGRRTALNAVTLALALILTNNICLSNQAYLNLYLRYENAYAFFTSLTADIRMTPGFDENSKLALIGWWEQPEFYDTEFALLDQLTGVRGFTPNDYSCQRFLEYYVDFEIPFASEEEIEAVKHTPEYQKMAVYPYYGSVKRIGDILVVKLS